jgi:hypothetical protein
VIKVWLPQMARELVAAQGALAFGLHPAPPSDRAQGAYLRNTREVILDVTLVAHNFVGSGKVLRVVQLAEMVEHMEKNMFRGVALRKKADGTDNGVRVVDLNGDGVSDVIVALDASSAVSREWVRATSSWREAPFPVSLRDSKPQIGACRGRAVLVHMLPGSRGTLTRCAVQVHVYLDASWVLITDAFPRRESCADATAVQLADVDSDGCDDILVTSMPLRPDLLPSTNAAAAACETIVLFGASAPGSNFTWNFAGAFSRFPVCSIGRGVQNLRPNGMDPTVAAAVDPGMRFADLDGDGAQDVLMSDAYGCAVYLQQPRAVPLGGGGGDGGGWLRVYDIPRPCPLPPLALADGSPSGAVVDGTRRIMWAANEFTASPEGKGAVLPACAKRPDENGDVIVFSFACLLNTSWAEQQ